MLAGEVCGEDAMPRAWWLNSFWGAVRLGSSPRDTVMLKIQAQLQAQFRLRGPMATYTVGEIISRRLEIFLYSSKVLRKSSATRDLILIGHGAAQREMTRKERGSKYE